MVYALCSRSHGSLTLARARFRLYAEWFKEHGGIFETNSMLGVAMQKDAIAAETGAGVVAALGSRSLVLVGMMGAGKSSIGRKLATKLGLPFVDADAEIEVAAGMNIPDIFARHGEASFRAGESRVIARLLDAGPQVLATGGGAFMNPETRAAIRAKAISIWLKADYDVLLKRIKRRSDRPMLKTDDPAATLRHLMAERDPAYAEADLTVHSRDVPHETIIAEILDALVHRFESSTSAQAATGDRAS